MIKCLELKVAQQKSEYMTFGLQVKVRVLLWA